MSVNQEFTSHKKRKDMTSSYLYITFLLPPVSSYGSILIPFCGRNLSTETTREGTDVWERVRQVTLISD